MNKSLTGYCLSIFAFSLLFSAIITGNYILKNLNRIDVCFYGAYCLVFYLFGMGSLEFVKNKQIVTIFALIFNLVGGIGNGLNCVASISVLSSYKDERETYIQYFELASGLAAMIGPLLGAGFYFFFKYRGPFFGLGFFYFLMILVFKIKRKQFNIYEQDLV